MKEPSNMNDITIPSILIDQESGEKILATAQHTDEQSANKESLIVAIDFPLGLFDKSWLHL